MHTTHVSILVTASYNQQGNSVARDLPRTGSETNTTIFVIYIMDIDSLCPYLLSGETTFQLTSCSNTLHVYLVRGLNLQKHHDCSHRSTSTNFGPGLDMTIIYQFLKGAKMGSLCGSHFGQIQDGHHPE